MTINPTSLGIDTNAQKSQLPVQEQAPVQPPPGALETFNSFLQRYVESNPALGLSNFQITPEALAVIGSKPENKLLAGIGSAAKGFSEGWGKVRAEQQATAVGEQKAQMENQKRLDDTISRVQGALKSDTNVNDELTRADSIAIAKDLLKNAGEYGDKFAGAFLPVFQAIIKPEFKRLQISEDGISNPADVFRVLTQAGIKGISEEGIQKLLGGGVLTPGEVAPFKSIIRDFEKRNKSNFTRYVTPYVNSFEDAGFGDYAERHIPVPEGYKIKPPKVGDRDTNSTGDPIVFDGKAWVLDMGDVK
jgi:hypothetical protein